MKNTQRKENDVITLLKRSLDPSISGIRITPLAGDASTRKYFRIHYTAPSPGSVIMMTLGTGDPRIVSEEITAASQGFTELPFVNILRHLEKTGLGVPKLLHDGHAEGFLILEDLGDDLLIDAARRSGPEDRRKLFEKAVDSLLIMQERGSRDDGGCYAFRQVFSRDVFLWEFHHFLEYAVIKKGKSIRPVDTQRFEEYFLDISRTLSSLPRVFTHRDYHGWNLLIKDGRIRIIDFQDALMGPPHYDLASLLSDRSTPDILGETLIEGLVAYYCRESGVSREDFQKPFDLACIQRCLKAVGRFEYIAQVKKNPGYLTYVPGTMTRVASLLSGLSDLQGLLDLLRKYLPDMQGDI